MLNILIYITVLSVYLPGLVWIARHNGIIKTPITSTFMLSSFVFVGFGSFYSFFSINATGKSLISLPYVIILCVQPFIFYISNFVWPFNKISRTNFSPRQKKISLSHHLINISLIWFVSFLIAFVYIYTNGMPLGYDMQNWLLGPRELVLMRQEQTYGRGFWLIKEGFYNLPTLAVVYSFIVWCFYRGKKTFLVMVISILVAILFSFSFLFKAPLFLIFACIFLASSIKNGKFEMRYIVYICLGAVLIFSMFFLIYIPGRDMDFYSGFLLQEIFDRIVAAYTVSLANALLHSLDTGIYYFGATLINPLGILPFEPVALARISHESLFGIIGNAPVPFLGEGFVNFSWMGIFMFFFTAIFILNILSFITKFIKDRITYIVFVVCVILYTYEFAFVSINNMISPDFILRLIFIYVLLTPWSIQLSKQLTQPEENKSGY